MTKTQTSGKPYKVQFSDNGRVRTTSHTSLRNAEIKVGQVMAAGRYENVQISVGGIAVVQAVDGMLGWTRR